jgi:hypothetical protein
VTGEIVDFGGRKPPQPGNDKALSDAKACFADHDPFQRVLDYIDRATARIEAAEQRLNAGPAAMSLNDEQVKALIYATERAAERGVGLYATRIRTWHQAIVAGVFVAGLVIGILGGYWVGARQSQDAVAEAARWQSWWNATCADQSPRRVVVAGKAVCQVPVEQAAGR